MRIKAVVFDFFATLTPGTPESVWAAHATQSAAPLGIPGEIWRKALDESFSERAIGALGNLESTFRVLAHRCGIAPDGERVKAACHERRAAQYTLFRLRDDAESVLTALRAAEIGLGVLSDCTIELAEAWPSLTVSKLVDAAVLSCEVGMRKPDPKMYQAIADQIGIAPEQCLYVGDGGGGELTGAGMAGMTPVMLRADDWHDTHTHNREDSWSGMTIGALSEVPGLLHTLNSHDHSLYPGHQRPEESVPCR